jgi:hypothetical protein
MDGRPRPGGPSQEVGPALASPGDVGVPYESENASVYRRGAAVRPAERPAGGGVTRALATIKTSAPSGTNS